MADIMDEDKSLQKELEASAEASENPEDIIIVYYCRECAKIASAKSMGKRKKYSFKCADCGNICAYGTSRGISSFFRIREGDENWQKIRDAMKKESPTSEQEAVEVSP